MWEWYPCSGRLLWSLETTPFSRTDISGAGIDLEDGSISGNGTAFIFSTKTNIVTDDSNGFQNIYRFSVLLETNELISVGIE